MLNKVLSLKYTLTLFISKYTPGFSIKRGVVVVVVGVAAVKTPLARSEHPCKLTCTTIIKRKSGPR